MRDLPDVRREHHTVLTKFGFEWIGGRTKLSDAYEGAYNRLGFRMYPEGTKNGTPDKEDFRVGTRVTVNVHVKKGEGKGEAYAPSIAVIIGILEDKRGSCHVALHYFWRFGQIHAGADMHPATALRYRAQIFLQKELTEKNGNAVKYVDGGFRDVVASIHINHRVVVLPHQRVMSSYTSALGQTPLDAFEASFAACVDVDSGCRDNGFWYDMTFDHSCYKFESVAGGELPRDQFAESDSEEEGGCLAAGTCAAANADVAKAAGSTRTHCRPTAAVHRLQINRGLTMGDAFCGLGTVSIAANTIGFQVEFGIDSSRVAISSFTDNTLWASGHFNPVTERSPRAEERRLEDVVAQLRQEQAAGKQLSLPRVDYLHLSPPCQNLSNKKKLEDRTFSGAEVKSAMELVQILLPSFVTLEEVPGFLMQRFLPQNLSGELAGYPNPPLQAAAQSSITGAAAACGGYDQPADDDSDIEGEGSKDVEQLECSDSEQGTRPVEQAQAGDLSAKGGVLLNPVLLAVSKLLDMGYQLRLALLNAAHYGVPQQRWRVFLFAALGPNATNNGFELPKPPPIRYSAPASVLKAAKGSSSRPRLPAKDTGFINRAGVPHEAQAGDWVDVLCLTEPKLDEHPAFISLQEAWGDLPPLLADASQTSLKGCTVETPAHNTPDESVAAAAAAAAAAAKCQQTTQQGGTQQNSSRQQQRRRRGSLGKPVVPYDPAAGVMNCPVPVQGAAPVSRYSRYMRSPHAVHQDVCMFNPATLRDHTATHSPREIQELLLVADRRKDADTQLEKAAWKDGKGRRPAADGVAMCVLGHNEPKRFCLHFKEPRYVTLAERRRAQSLPDFVCIVGDHREKEQQVGNAVPYLLAAEVAASVWEAATGQQARRPPLLNGPCQDGVGVTEPLARAHYSIWLHRQQRQSGWQGLVQVSRECLEQEAKLMQLQQKQERLGLLREQQDQNGNAASTSPAPLHQQQQGQEQQRQEHTANNGTTRKKPRSSKKQAASAPALG